MSTCTDKTLCCADLKSHSFHILCSIKGNAADYFIPLSSLTLQCSISFTLIGFGAVQESIQVRQVNLDPTLMQIPEENGFYCLSYPRRVYKKGINHLCKKGITHCVQTTTQGRFQWFARGSRNSLGSGMVQDEVR